MKERTPEQLKGQVKNFANKRSLMPQEVLQIFFMERVLERLSKSKYASNFILKGGLLISSEWREIIEDILNDIGLKNLWNNYSKANTYAANISYTEIMKTVERVAEIINS